MPNSPYTEQNDTGYNASPPPDGGEQTSANEITWAGIKTKLADPILAFVEAVDDAVAGAFAKVINTDADENNAVAGSIAFTSSELTISSGSVTAARSHHTIDTEADAASDDLDTIVVTGVSDGALLFVRAENTARTIVVKHGTGNIQTADGADFSIDDAVKSLTLQRRGTDWHELNRSVVPSDNYVQTVNVTDGAVATGTTTLAADDSIPQNTEGDEYMTLAITPSSATSQLVIEVVALVSPSNNNTVTVALFQDATAGALAGIPNVMLASQMQPVVFRHVMTSGTTIATTFKVRAGVNSAATLTFNGVGAARVLGGVCSSSITIREVLA